MTIPSAPGSQPTTTAPDSPAAPDSPSAASPSPDVPPGGTDRLAPFRELFGLPVAVQFLPQLPYIQIGPRLDPHGSPETRVLPGTDRVIGLPEVVDASAPTHVAIGVLGPSKCGTWLVIEERLGIPRSAESPGGTCKLNVHVRPESVTHVTFVKEVEVARRRGADS